MSPVRRVVWLLVAVVLAGCTKAPPRAMPVGGPSRPLQLIGLSYDRVPFLNVVPATYEFPATVWVAGDQVSANRQLLRDQIQQGRGWMIVGSHLNWSLLHEELGLTSPVALVESTDNLKAFAMGHSDGVPRYVLVFGSGEALPPVGLLAETSIAPQPSMAPHAALQGGPAYDLLATAVVAWAEPPYGWVRVSYTWYWQPGGPGGPSAFAIADRVQVRDGRYAAQGMGGSNFWDAMVLDPDSYRSSARTETFSLRDSTVQPGASLDISQVWLDSCRQPRPGSDHVGPVELDPVPEGIRSATMLGTPPNLVQWNLRGGRGCVPDRYLPDQFVFWAGGQFLVKGPSGREALTYRSDWTGAWQVDLWHGAQHYQALTWRLSPPAGH